MRVAVRVLTFLAVLVPVAGSVRAQGPAAVAAVDGKGLPVYDVATIKPNKTGSGHSSISVDDAVFRTENVSLRSLLQNAFDVRKEQIEGLPPWAESARWDINAKVVDPDMKALEKLKPEERRAMLQTLLTERFALKWHFESRVMSSYELVVAKSGVLFKEGASPKNSGVSQNNTSLKATSTPMTRLAAVLSDELHRPVVDKTGLSGGYDFSLKWTPDDVSGSGDRGVKEEDAPPTLFTALQEQLGLRLQAGKDPIAVLVIDRLELPTEN